MLQLFFGSILLSLVHAAIPNHWLPVVAIGKAENWTQRETLLVAAISGFAHTISTVLVGITIGIIGISLSRNYAFISEKVAPALLIVLGVIYLIIDRLNHHKHTHGTDTGKIRSRSKWAIVISLALAMFLSPCIEIEAYYFVASSLGWLGILIVSFVYLFVTVGGMLLLVYSAYKGIAKLKWHFMEHHERLVSGIVLIILGIVGFLI